MRKNFMYKCLIIFISAVLLAACATVTPNSLGISQDQWNQYTPEQKREMNKGYREVQKQAKQKQEISSNSTLSVNIYGGQILLPPFTYLKDYQPIAFAIKEGDCNVKLPVIEKNNPQIKTTLKVCYKNNVLFLDPSPYLPSQAQGSIQLHHMPTWTRGFTYPGISSTGLVKLTGVNVFIKEQ
jgi:hypothetical protein